MKKTILSLSFFCWFFISFAQTQGPNDPAAGTEESAGCLSCTGSEWNNFSDAFTNNGLDAYVNLTAYPSCFQSACYTSRELYVSDFGFSIPANATITGIKAEIKRSSGSGSVGNPAIKDSIVQLMTAVGTTIGQNKKLPAFWSNVSNYVVYGGPTDLWASSWTPSDVNDSDFGLSLAVKNSANSVQTANVDHIRITVYYTLPVNVNELHSQSSGISLLHNPDSPFITISAPGQVISSTTVYDVLGNAVLRSEPNNTTAQINTSFMEKGVYFLQTITDKGTKVIKFIP